MAGRTCVVTGANSGIGLVTARELARLGASVVMVSRSKERGERALEKVKSKAEGGKVELVVSDFASLASVRGLAARLVREHESLEVLVNNAGLANVRRSVTADGFETTFQVNYLSQFLLTVMLLGSLKKGATSRIVNVSSVGHFSGRIDFDDLQTEKGYGVMKAYSQSKLAMVLFTYELARRLQGTGVTANCLHPGTVATNIWGRSLGPASFLTKVSRLFMSSPETGAKTSVYLASSPAVEGVTGKYFDRMVERQSSQDSYDEDLARKLWETSVRLLGLRQEELPPRGQ